MGAIVAIALPIADGFQQDAGAIAFFSWRSFQTFDLAAYDY
ncbi:MAG: hypothetical protein AAFX40_16475 [Cyanobacteria bacterium J06639_1]